MSSVKWAGRPPPRGGATTAGVVLVTKDEDVRHKIGRQFEEREIEKEYLAIVEGEMTHDEGSVDLALERASSTTVPMNVRDYTFLGTTRSLCPHCRRLVDAKIIVRQGRVYFRKRCPEHGTVEDFVCSDVAYYERHEFDQPARLNDLLVSFLTAHSR